MNSIEVEIDAVQCNGLSVAQKQQIIDKVNSNPKMIPVEFTPFDELKQLVVDLEYVIGVLESACIRDGKVMVGICYANLPLAHSVMGSESVFAFKFKLVGTHIISCYVVFKELLEDL
jgi:hypothetical protein